MQPLAPPQYIGEVVSAWSDTRVFKDGHWNYEGAAPQWRSLHDIAGRHFYAIGDPLSTEALEDAP